MNSKHDSGDHMFRGIDRLPKIHNPIFLLFAAVYYIIAADQGRKWVREYREEPKNNRRLAIRLWNCFLLGAFGGMALKASTMDTRMVITEIDLPDPFEKYRTVDGDIDMQKLNDAAERGDIVLPDREQWDQETGEGLAEADAQSHP